MRLAQPFVMLPIQTDIAALVAEVLAIGEDVWRPHPEGMPGNSALPLVAVLGNPEDDSVEGPMRPTPHLHNLPAIVNLLGGLSALGCPIGRTRLMRIDIESEVTPHVDTNRYWWDHLRVHIPIVTDPAVEFEVAGASVHMAAGECWVFDTWSSHRVVNPVDAPRVHLVIDTVGGAGFWSLIDRATGAIPADSPLPELVPVTSIAFETMNQPTVLPSSEIDATLAAILREYAEIDLDAAVALDLALIPFRRSWKACWAHFGNSPEGFSAFRKLLADARSISGASDTPLSNGISVSDAIGSLVIHPALSKIASNPDTPVTPPTATIPTPTPAPAPDPALDSGSAPATPTAIPASPAQRAAPEPIILDRPVFIVSSPRAGSTMLFEALGRAKQALTIGSESHQIFENIQPLRPSTRGWDSNQLTAEDVTPGVVNELSTAFVHRLRDREGNQIEPGSVVRMVEKTPKNALRVPFLAAAYPDAKFVYLFRDPRETVSSMLDAWRSGQFVTYPDLPDWTGDRWSMLLTPGWRDLIGKSLPEVVANQWATTTQVLLDDLEQLDADRWCVASYAALVANPDAELSRICAYLDLTWDQNTVGALPNSATTLEAPRAEKWERNAEELQRVWAIVDPVAARAHEVFAEPPRIPANRTRSAEAVQVSLRDEPDGNIPTDFSSVFTGSFGAILEAANVSLAATTYQSGRLVLVRRDGNKVNTHLRYFSSPMGIAVQGSKLALGTKTTVWEFWNQQAAAKTIDPEGKVDACYMPRRGHVTGDVRIHDLSYDSDDVLWAVATRFSSLVTFDREYSFTPRWRPPFISKLSADDRCHLNGLAMVDGKPRYVTVLGLTDTANGWRDDKSAGGAILDIEGGAPVTVGLSMPHSPRWHDGKLWVLESGRGALCTVDVETGQIETVAILPGFTRGLSFAGPYAFVGLSKVRETVFDGLPITKTDTPRECGVWAVDTRTGEVAGFLRFEGTVSELFEVAVLPGQQFPELVEPGADATNDAFVLSDEALADVADTNSSAK